VKIEYVPARPGDFSGKEVSSQLAKNELGWEPRMPFEEGVRRYIEWYKAKVVMSETNWARVDQALK
jgi:UDP-glucose 4-epimerase